MSDPKQFGEYLRKQRKKKGLTLVELSEKSGVSQPYLSQIENGKGGIPSPEILFKLTNPLGLRHTHLMLKAGHIQLGPNEHEDDFLETEYEAEFYKQRDSQKYKEMIGKNRIMNDLTYILEQPNITFKDHLLTNDDRKLLLDMLNRIYPDQK